MYEHSKTATPAPGDELQGGWSRARLEEMDLCFRLRAEAAIRRGEEHAPGPGNDSSG